MRRAAGWVYKALVLLVFIACPWLAHLAMGENVAVPLLLALAVPHAAVYLFLLWLFGRTLRQGREPLITAVARRVHGTLAPEMESYTRRVTVAWCIFCSIQLVVAGLLLAFASPDTWALFVGAFNLPLLALMFTGEYLYRIARYPNHPRASISQMLRAFARDASISAGANAR